MRGLPPKDGFNETELRDAWDWGGFGMGAESQKRRQAALRSLGQAGASNYAETALAVEPAAMEGTFRPWIWTSPTTLGGRLACRFFEGMPVRAKDFSQSWIEGPRMSPSMKARPGQRVQPEIWPQPEQVCKLLLEFLRRPA